MISIIVSIAKNNAMGQDNKLLYRLPTDMKRFKEKTLGHTLIMGRKTFESIGHALPDRKNIVISRDEKFQAPGCEVFSDFNKALARAREIEKEEIFIIGGAEIIKQGMIFANKLYLTVVDDEPINADTFMPDFHSFNKILKEEDFNENGYKYKILELSR